MNNKNSLHPRGVRIRILKRCLFWAEEAGFEPAIPILLGIPALQAGPFVRSGTPPREKAPNFKHQIPITKSQTELCSGPGWCLRFTCRRFRRVWDLRFVIWNFPRKTGDCPEVDQRSLQGAVAAEGLEPPTSRM